MAEEAWSSSVCDNIGPGMQYCMCPCCFGADAVNQIGEALGGVDFCGVPLDNWFCWVFCEFMVIRNMRGSYRSTYNKEGNCIEDMCLGDNCPGCALAQMEADLN